MKVEVKEIPQKPKIEVILTLTEEEARNIRKQWGESSGFFYEYAQFCDALDGLV